MPEYGPLEQVVGTVSRAPEETQTSNGKYICKFSIAVPLSYGQGEGTTKFVNVAVWNEDLGRKLANGEIYKGAKVACEGNGSSREYNGKTYYDFNAVRVGIVAWISRNGSQAAAKAKTDDDDVPF